MDVLTRHIAGHYREDDASEPRHAALGRAITTSIESGEIEAGKSLPSERALSTGLGLSRVTVRRAIGDLVDRGLLQRRHGARTTVAPRVEKQLSALSSFSEDIRSRDMEPGVRWIGKEITRASPAEAMALGLAPEEKVVRLRRIRLADNRPIAIEHCAIPQALLPSAEFDGNSLYSELQRRGLRPVRGTQRIRAGLMTAEEAEMLKARPGAALLIIERRCLLETGQAIEFTQTRYHAEYYDFVTGIGG